MYQALVGGGFVADRECLYPSRSANPTGIAFEQRLRSKYFLQQNTLNCTLQLTNSIEPKNHISKPTQNSSVNDCIEFDNSNNRNMFVCKYKCVFLAIN
jgi:hypothetical protein